MRFSMSGRSREAIALGCLIGAIVVASASQDGAVLAGCVASFEHGAGVVVEAADDRWVVLEVVGCAQCGRRLKEGPELV